LKVNVMRVNIVLPEDNLGGGARVISMYAEHLRRQGHQVLVVSLPGRPPPLPIRIKSLLTGRGWPQTAVGPSYYDLVEVEHRVIDSYRPITDRDLPDADVVVATWWETAEWVAKLSSRKGAKAYLIQQMESNFPGQPADRIEATWRLPMQKIVVSQWLTDVARDRFGDSSSIIVPNGIDLNLFHAIPRGKQPHPTVGFLYAPKSPHKGTATALAAIDAASRRIPGLHVRAFGFNSVEPEAPLPPGSEYYRMPPQQSLRDIYAGCDVWLCTSTSEGYHLPPHEAMACRCPVVSTRVGGPMDLIEDGVTGYLVDVGDTGGLTDGLVEILGLPEPAWKRMSEAAYESVKNFTWEKATILFERALEVAIERFGSGFFDGQSPVVDFNLKISGRHE
jgi:glycosyltransferase involved in cell wall biosynthesis